jgi:hypothetical protein
VHKPQKSRLASRQLPFSFLDFPGFVALGSDDGFLLVDAGADMDKARGDGVTPLWIASQSGQVIVSVEGGGGSRPRDGDGDGDGICLVAHVVARIWISYLATGTVLYTYIFVSSRTRSLSLRKAV